MCVCVSVSHVNRWLLLLCCFVWVRLRDGGPCWFVTNVKIEIVTKMTEKLQNPSARAARGRGLLLPPLHPAFFFDLVTMLTCGR